MFWPPFFVFCHNSARELGQNGYMSESSANSQPPEKAKGSNFVSHGFRAVARVARTTSANVDQASELALVGGPIGVAADAVMEAGATGLYAGSVVANVAADISEGKVLDGARHAVSGAIGTAVTAVPFVEHFRLTKQSKLIARGEYKKALEVKSVAENIDDGVSSLLGGKKEEAPQVASKVEEKKAESKKPDDGILKSIGESIKKVAGFFGFIPGIGGAIDGAGRVAKGTLAAASEATDGNVGGAANEAAAGISGAAVAAVPFVSVADAALAAKNVNEKGLVEGIQSHHGVADRLEAKIRGEELDKDLAAESAPEESKEKKPVGPHSAAILAQRGEGQQKSGSFVEQVSGNKSSRSASTSSRIKSSNKAASQVEMLRARNEAEKQNGGGRGVGSGGREVARNKPAETGAKA